MNAPSEKQRKLLLSLGITLVTFIAYWPLLHHPFLRYDDFIYITENPAVQSGISWKSVRWAFTTFYADNWHPLTWVSHMLDCQWFGLKAGGHHLVSLALHSFSAVLLMLTLHRMTRALWTSAFVAAMFALHPLHVESVAWIAERKDVLSGFFFMLTLWTYTR